MEIQTNSSNYRYSPSDFEKYIINIRLSDWVPIDNSILETNINVILDEMVHKIRTVTKGDGQTLYVNIEFFLRDWLKEIFKKICSSEEIMSKIDDLDFQESDFRFKDLVELFKLYRSHANPKKWPYTHIDMTPAFGETPEDIIKTLKEEIEGRRTWAFGVKIPEDPWQEKGDKFKEMEVEEEETEERTNEKKKRDADLAEFAKILDFVGNIL